MEISPNSMESSTSLASTWRKKNERWTKQIVYEGDGICIFPGDPYLMEVQLERYLKQIAYTSERGIDFWIEQVAERVGDRIFRGVIFKLDPWLYDKMMTTL
jgi:hypothetical protein